MAKRGRPPKARPVLPAEDASSPVRRLASLEQLAAEIGVGEDYVRDWLGASRLSPVVVDGADRYDSLEFARALASDRAPPALARWAAQLVADPGRPLAASRVADPPSAPAPRRPAPAPVLEYVDPVDAVAEAIRKARSVAEIAQVAQEVAAMTVEGKITPHCAKALKELLSRASTDRKQPDEDGVSRVAFVSEQAAQLARRFELLLDGRRRARIVALLESELRQDEERYPTSVKLDPVEMRRRLEEDGLDAWGDPVAYAS